MNVENGCLLKEDESNNFNRFIRCLFTKYFFCALLHLMEIELIIFLPKNPCDNNCTPQKVCGSHCFI